MNNALNSIIINVITANDLKKKGVSLIDDHIKNDDELIITVRGKNKYVVIDMDKYNYLRECELEKAINDSKEDIKNGKYYQESVEEHIKRIKNA